MGEQTPQTARAGGEPLAVQFSVFLANRVGQLKELLDAAARERIDILGLSIVDSTDWAVVRVVFPDPEKARQMLRSRSLPFTDSEVLLVVLPDRASLHQVADTLFRAEVNLLSAYPLILRWEDHPIVALHVDENSMAVQALRREGFALLGDDDLIQPKSP